MLADVLEHDRIFAIAKLDEDARHSSFVEDPPHDVATVGYIRACEMNEDGTSNLLLQGVSRVHIEGISQEFPYRVIDIKLLESQSFDRARLLEQRAEIQSLLHKLADYDLLVPINLRKFLEQIEDPEAYIDISAANFCPDKALRQVLLETLSTEKRYQLYHNCLQREQQSQQLDRQLRGDLGAGEAILN